MTAFEDVFGGAADLVWRAPARVNVIGEFTDYNEGLVLPIALPSGVDAWVRAASHGLLRVASTAFPGGPVEVALDDGLEPGAVTGWAAYPAAVCWALRRRAVRIGGLDVVIDGDVPHGAGLASSAAVECAVAAAVDDLYGLGMTRVDLAALAREAENGFVGVPCGVLDQSASLLCTGGHALLLDTRSMEYRHIPFDLDSAGLALLVIDTRARHRHTDGGYAARRADCMTAARILARRALRDVAPGELDAVLTVLPSDRLRRRARHIITENARVQQVADLLDLGADPRRIGPLLTASHTSLRDDFEVSCRELDLAVDAALAAGAHGARLTGGGFGGSAIALVDADSATTTTRAVTAAFTDAGLPPPRVFPAAPQPGAHRADKGSARRDAS